MPSIRSIGSNGSVKSDQSPTSVQPSDNGNAGMRKVNPFRDAAQVIPKQNSHDARSDDVLEGAQPSQGRRLVQDRPEVQLGRLLASDELAQCYKLRSKDLYFDASLYALKNLRNCVAHSDPQCDSVKIVSDFNESLAAVRSRLTDMGGDNASDLNITINTEQYGTVQLIPLSLKEVEPGQLAELLDIALELTEEAVQQWRGRSDYPAIKKKYSQNIAQHDPQIANLLASIQPEDKEAFTRQVECLQYPRVQMQFGPERQMTLTNTGKQVPTPSDHNALGNDRFMDKAVKLYRHHSELADPRGYLAQQQALTMEMEKMRRVVGASEDELATWSQGPLTEWMLPDDGTGLFRGVLALANEDERWISASKADLLAEMNSGDMRQSVGFAINGAINTYLEFEPVNDAQRTMGNVLRKRAAKVDLASVIFAAAFARGKFSHRSVGDLARALGLEAVVTSAATDPDAAKLKVELKVLAEMIYKAVLVEFKVPESGGQKFGLRWQHGRYSLMVERDSFAGGV